MTVIDTGLKSTIDYTPTVAEVSAFLLAGNGVDALGFAMSQLVPPNIEWDFDRANSRVSYVIRSKDGGYSAGGLGERHSTAEAACRAYVSYIDGRTPSHSEEFVSVSSDKSACYFNQTPHGGVTSSRYEPIVFTGVAPETVHILIDTVSNQILADAIEGNAASQATLTQTTLNKFANNDFAVELDANAVPF